MKKISQKNGLEQWMRKSPGLVIALSFVLLIAVGTFLLSLPAASRTGKSIGVFDAAFISTSAVCVTGLTVRDTAQTFSVFGRGALILLIQCGGLGLMTIASVGFMLLGRRMTLQNRVLIQESMNEEDSGGMAGLVRWVVGCTFIIELTGALLMSVRMIPRYGTGKGILYALFHSISAFCNAGFDLFGDSMAGYSGDVLMNVTVMLLIVSGGLGFGVMSDVVKQRSFAKFRLQTKLVLLGTGALLLNGWILFLAFEWNNALAGMNFGEKLLASLFQSVTFRTAGFYSVDMSGMRTVTKLWSCGWMFVGAAPASTGGGMKVTTMAVMVLTIASAVRGSDDTIAFRRTISKNIVRRALIIIVMGASVFLVDLFVLCALEENIPLIDLAFECASAVGTVGVTSCGTANLCAASRIMLMATMFIGRVGPLSVALALSARKETVRGIRYPEERIMVG